MRGPKVLVVVYSDTFEWNLYVGHLLLWLPPFYIKDFLELVLSTFISSVVLKTYLPK